MTSSEPPTCEVGHIKKADLEERCPTGLQEKLNVEPAITLEIIEPWPNKIQDFSSSCPSKSAFFSCTPDFGVFAINVRFLSLIS